VKTVSDDLTYFVWSKTSTQSVSQCETVVDSGDDVELTCHDGTVRDVIFMPDTSARSSLLVSGGAGDCKICVTDCSTGSLLRAMPGHSGHLHLLSAVF